MYVSKTKQNGPTLSYYNCLRNSVFATLFYNKEDLRFNFHFICCIWLDRETFFFFSGHIDHMQHSTVLQFMAKLVWGKKPSSRIYFLVRTAAAVDVLCDVAAGGRACLCFGSKEEVARRKKGGDVTGVLKLLGFFGGSRTPPCWSVPGSLWKYNNGGV